MGLEVGGKEESTVGSGSFWPCTRQRTSCPNLHNVKINFLKYACVVPVS